MYLTKLSQILHALSFQIIIFLNYEFMKNSRGSDKLNLIHGRLIKLHIPSVFMLIFDLLRLKSIKMFNLSFKIEISRLDIFPLIFIFIINYKF